MTKYITVKLTEDQLSWLIWCMQTDIDSDPEAYGVERKAFIRRLASKLAKAKTV